MPDETIYSQVSFINAYVLLTVVMLYLLVGLHIGIFPAVATWSPQFTF